MIYFYAILSTVIVSLMSFFGLLIISVKQDHLKKIIFFVVSLSVGALFGDAFIHLIPDAFESGLNIHSLSISILAGIILFFIIEKFLHWHHSHVEHDHCIDCASTHENNVKPLGAIILFADGMHNFIDGIIIGLSFLLGIEVGIATTLAVVLHEIPQEVSDFALLLHAGYSRGRALFLNFISSSMAILGTIVALFIGVRLENFIPIGLAVAAGGFIYVAGSDLVPELHKTRNVKKSLLQIFTILLGFAFMYLLTFFE